MPGGELGAPFDPKYNARSMHISRLRIPSSCRAYLPDNYDEGACRILIQPAPELGAPEWTTSRDKRALLAVYRDEGRPASPPPFTSMSWSSDGTTLRCFVTGETLPYFAKGDEVSVVDYASAFQFTGTIIRLGISPNSEQAFDLLVPEDQGLQNSIGDGMFAGIAPVNFYEDYVIFRSLPDFRVMNVDEALELLDSWEPVVQTGFDQLIDPVTGAVIQVPRKPFINATTPEGQRTPSLHRQQFNEENNPMRQTYDARGRAVGSKLRYTNKQNASVLQEPDRFPMPAGKLLVNDYYGFALNDVERLPYVTDDLITFDSSLPTGIRRKVIYDKVAYSGKLYDDFGLPVTGALDADQLMLRDPIMPLQLDQFNVPFKNVTPPATTLPAVSNPDELEPFEVIFPVPINIEPPTITGNVLGEPSIIDYGVWENAEGGFYAVWYLDGNAVGFGVSEFTTTDAPENDGLILYAEITAQGSGGNTTMLTNELVMESHQAPTCANLPLVDGSPYVDEVLTVSEGEWNYNPTSFSYQWYRGAKAIVDETNTQYTLTSDDVGENIFVRVTAYNGYGQTTVDTADTEILPTILPSVVVENFNGPFATSLVPRPPDTPSTGWGLSEVGNVNSLNGEDGNGRYVVAFDDSRVIGGGAYLSSLNNDSLLKDLNYHIVIFSTGSSFRTGGVQTLIFRMTMSFIDPTLTYPDFTQQIYATRLSTGETLCSYSDGTGSQTELISQEFALNTIYEVFVEILPTQTNLYINGILNLSMIVDRPGASCSGIMFEIHNGYIDSINSTDVLVLPG
jgi:hypothetical protein